MKKTDVIFTNWRMFAELTKGQLQGAFFERKLADGRDVHVVALADVFTEDEIRKIKDYVRPEQKICFKNAHILTSLFPDRVKYVEGEVTICGGGIGIEHAWNLVDGEHYVDLTFELALGEDVTKEGYVMLGAYDAKTLRRVTHKTGYYGGIYQNLYINRINKRRK